MTNSLPSRPPHDRPRPSTARYWVLALLCLSATIAYVQRNSIGVAESTIRGELHLDEQQMGWVISAFFITYAVFQLPAGVLVGRWGSRRALVVLTVVWSLATGGLGLCRGWFGLLVTRAAMGAAQAGVFPAATTVIAHWLPATHRGTAAGALSAFMYVGGAVGAIVTGLALESVGWRWLYVLYALPGLAWAAWFALWFRDDPAQHPSVNEGELSLLGRASRTPAHRPTSGTRDDSVDAAVPWGAIFRSRAMGAIAAQHFFRAAAAIFFASWFATYMQQTRGVTAATSGLLTSLPVAAVVPGSLVGGILSDRILRRTGSRRLGRQMLSAVAVWTAAGFIIAAMAIDDAWLAAAVIAAGSFCAALSGPCAYSITIDMGGAHVATVFSVMNTAGNVGAVLFPLAVPGLVAWSGDWNLVLLIFAGLYVAAGICWLAFDSSGSIVEPREPAGAA